MGESIKLAVLACVVMLAFLVQGCLGENRYNGEIYVPNKTVLVNNVNDDSNTQRDAAQTSSSAPTPSAANETPAAAVIEPAQPTQPASVQSGTVHIISINDTGFVPAEITINAGDTVTWRNIRNMSSRQRQAYVIGTSLLCKRPKLQGPYPQDVGEEYSYIFTEVQECTYVDGIRTSQSGKITVK